MQPFAVEGTIHIIVAVTQGAQILGEILGSLWNLAQQPQTTGIVHVVFTRSLTVLRQLHKVFLSLFRLSCTGQRPRQYPLYVDIVSMFIVQLIQQSQGFLIVFHVQQAHCSVQHVAHLAREQHHELFVVFLGSIVHALVEKLPGTSCQRTFVIGFQTEGFLIVRLPQEVLHVVHLLRKTV